MAEEYIEVSEKTLDDAITAACRRLSVTSDKLEYVVVDQGSSGFLGFNARKAVIKAKVKANAEGGKQQGDVLTQAPAGISGAAKSSDDHVLTLDEIDAKAEAAARARANQPEEDEEVRKPEKDRKETYGRGRDNRRRKEYDGRNSRGARDDFAGRSGRGRNERRGGRRTPEREYEIVDTPEVIPESTARKEEPHIDYTDEQIRNFESAAKNFLGSVFTAMGMEVTVHTDFDKEENVLLLDFEGENMGVLIGKRGATLDSIQYLVSLIVDRDIEGYVHVKADTENYRERRKKTLEALARNIASKVKTTRRSVALEPMNPYERRIIHSALQGDKYVTTYSEGEDPYRKVVVTLRK